MNISVIIPTYNRAAFLTDTVTSILKQTILPKEIIIIDDGSVDNTKDIVEKLIDQNPYLIKYISQQNQGVSSARNTGIKNSSHEWICFLDSDDIWEQEKLEHQINFHKINQHILFSHTNELWLFNNKEVKKKKHHKKPKGWCFSQNINNTLIGTSTVMIHRSILNKIGYFDENLKACEDYDLWLRILQKYQLGYIEQKLTKKIAGHKGQLSFETPMMDTFRIYALLKHKEGKYKKIIKDEIIKKSTIMIQGARKHQNKTIERHYTDLLKNLQ